MSSNCRAAALLVVACLAQACPSPLLNHRNPSEPGQKLEKADGEPSDACTFSFAKQGLCASMTWEKKPTEDEKGGFILRFWEKAKGTEHGPYVDPQGKVFSKLWMPSMGHGSSKIVVAQKKDASGANIPGVYDATGVYFTMPGDWEIWVELREGTTVTEKAKIDVSI